MLVGALLADLGRPDVRVSAETLAQLRSHAWPGNVRELKNAISCAVAFLEPGATTLEPRHMRLLCGTSDDSFNIDGLPLAGQTLARLERAAILQTLRHAHGNKVWAAKTLGIAVSTLYEKLKKYGLTDQVID